MPKHVLTIKVGDSHGAKGWRWYVCSCGQSGTAGAKGTVAQREAHARKEFKQHVRRARAEERKAQVREAAPELLRACKEFVALPVPVSHVDAWDAACAAIAKATRKEKK